MKKILLSFSFLFSLMIFITGCGPSHVTVGSRPTAPYYARPVAPGSRYIWVEGEWIRQRHGYVYQKGYWAAPRKRYHEYVGGHWQRKNRGWYWTPGHWN